MPSSAPLAAPPGGLQAAVIGFAIRFRGVIVALALVLLGYGTLSVMRAKYDVFPEFAPPQVGIQTEAPGLTAEQVEILVTQPIENAINGVPAVQSLRSSSIQGLSVITIIFRPESDIYRDRQVVGERLAEAARQLPSNVAAPTMTPLTSSSSTVLVLGLTSEKRSLMDLRTLADWTLRLRLLAVPGVAKVAVFGGDVRSIQVQVHPDELVRYNLAFDDVLAAAKKATAVTGAGFIETNNQRIVFQSEGQSIDPEDVARTVVASSGGSSVLLKDVADVVNAPEPAIGGAAVQGKPGVVLLVSGQLGANTIDVSDRIEDALADLKPVIKKEGVELRADLFRPADFIGISTRNVQKSLLLGGVLVVVVLILFLFDLRTATISCMAIPLSLLAAIVVLNSLGATLNAMTLGGLAIAIGEVVDDAVIDVENIARRLRENRRRAVPLPTEDVILNASLEVRGAVVYATFAVILVFLPVVMLPGLAGRFFAPLGLAYVLAILASLVVALVVTPALCMLLASKTTEAEGTARASDDPPVTRWLRKGYERMLRGIVARPRTTIAGALAFTVVGLAALPFFGAGFLPELKEGHFTLHMAAVPGTSIAESQRIGTLVTNALLELPFVRVVSQRIGRAEKADDTWGTHYSEFEVDLKRDLSGAESDEAQAAMRKVLATFPGVNFALKPFLTERVEESLSGYTASVIVNIYGNDLDALDEAARSVARELSEVQGATEVQLQSPPGMPQLTIRQRKADLERWGLDSVDVLNMLRGAYQGDIVGQSYEGNRVFNVITMLDEESRNSVSKVADLPLRTPAGTFVALHQIADVYQTAGRYQVQHLGGQRVQAVTANVIGRDVASFVQQARKEMAQVQLPHGVHLEFAGSAEAQAEARRNLLMNSVVAGLGIIMLLAVVTGSWRNVLLVLANMPFALVGGVLAVFATGGVLTLGSMVGFVTLFGITLRNSIMMISHFEHLVGEEGVTWGPEAAVKGAGDRLAPILMTSIVTALGLLPLALGMNEPGREIEGPMALVIVGGLLTSMALNLLVLPTLALRYGRFQTPSDRSSVPPADLASRRRAA
ncbi:MAG: efflux RND transporter permease subunit [Hyphomicrobium sp.]